ncbi:DUF3592 domain-containing protein [Kitasatospora sp. NPDC002040]|uniref:DUF3592 domain-containing protein n=1 Tax=Kitasatospora sp. NPDC002040 TaxID=3154661 RepID=UPI003323F173
MTLEQPSGSERRLTTSKVRWLALCAVLAVIAGALFATGQALDLPLCDDGPLCGRGTVGAYVFGGSALWLAATGAALAVAHDRDSYIDPAVRLPAVALAAVALGLLGVMTVVGGTARLWLLLVVLVSAGSALWLDLRGAKRWHYRQRMNREAAEVEYRLDTYGVTVTGRINEITTSSSTDDAEVYLRLRFTYEVDGETHHGSHFGRFSLLDPPRRGGPVTVVHDPEDPSEYRVTVPVHQPEPEPQPVPAPVPQDAVPPPHGLSEGGREVMAALERLVQLNREGALTDAEFGLAKSRILGPAH